MVRVYEIFLAFIYSADLLFGIAIIVQQFMVVAYVYCVEDERVWSG